MTKRKDPKAARPPRSLENTDPEKFADFFVQFAEDPECNVAALAKRCDMSRQAAHLIVKRLGTRYLPVLQEVEKVSTKTILKQIDEALPLALARMADKDFVATAKYKELAFGVGVMVDKRQLMRGEPTQIMTFEERKSMKELEHEIFGELRKRGQKPVDVEYEDIPPEGPDDPGVTTWAARQQTKREGRGRV